jgi:hypothetical protein
MALASSTGLYAPSGRWASSAAPFPPILQTHGIAGSPHHSGPWLHGRGRLAQVFPFESCQTFHQHLSRLSVKIFVEACHLPL